jgi:hypothetical protein
MNRKFDYLWLALLRDKGWLPNFIREFIDWIRYL